MKRVYFATLMILLFTVGAAQADFFKELEKFTNPESKEGKILSGATQVVSSAKEMDYATERTIGESLALEGLQGTIPVRVQGIADKRPALNDDAYVANGLREIEESVAGSSGACSARAGAGRGGGRSLRPVTARHIQSWLNAARPA